MIVHTVTHTHSHLRLLCRRRCVPCSRHFLIVTIYNARRMYERIYTTHHTLHQLHPGACLITWYSLMLFPGPMGGDPPRKKKKHPFNDTHSSHDKMLIHSYILWYVVVS